MIMTTCNLFFMNPVLAGVVAVFAAVIIAHVLRRSGAARPLPPGPAGYPIVGALPLVGARPHSGLAALARRYGPIMYLKMGTTRVVVASTASAASSFLKTLDARFANRPPNPVRSDITYGGNALVFGDYGPLWKLFRRVCNLHILGPKAMEGWSDVRRSEVLRMVRSVKYSGERAAQSASVAREATAAAAGPPLAPPLVAVADLVLCATGNIIGEVVLSRRFYDAETEGGLRFKETLAEFLACVGSFNIGNFVPEIAWMDLQGVQAKVKKAHKKYDELVSKLLAEHAATAAGKKERPDVVDVISERELLSEVQTKGLILDFFAAGTETTSIAVEWALAEMLKNPAVLECAQAELDGVVGRDRLVGEGDLPKLPYLLAVCKETLRKHPTTPLSLPHYSFEPAEAAGFHIPAGTGMLLNIWAIGRDPDVWVDPEKFDPERFLGGGVAGDLDLIQFGIGRRICAGKQVGMVMVQYLLGALVHGFDWSVPEGKEKMDMEETSVGPALHKAVPLAAFATPRLPPHAY